MLTDYPERKPSLKNISIPSLDNRLFLVYGRYLDYPTEPSLNHLQREHFVLHYYLSVHPQSDLFVGKIPRCPLENKIHISNRDNPHFLHQIVFSFFLLLLEKGSLIFLKLPLNHLAGRRPFSNLLRDRQFCT